METALALKTDVITERSRSALLVAHNLVIESNADYLAADDFCAELKEIEKEIVTTFKKPKEDAWTAHKSIVAAEAKHLEPVVEARKIAKGKMGTWQTAQDEIRRKEEERLRQEAQKKAEDDALRAAEAAEKNGDKETAEALIQAPVEAAPIVLPKETPKTKTTFRETWKADITHRTALLANIIARPELWNLLAIDESALRKFAEATKGAVRLNGVRFYSVKV